MQYFFEFSLMSFKATPVPFCIVFRLFCPHSYQLYQLYQLYSFMHPIFSFYFCCIHFTQGRYTIIGWDFGFSNKPIAFFWDAGHKQRNEQLSIFMSSLLKYACWTGPKTWISCNRTNPQDSSLAHQKRREETTFNWKSQFIYQ